jgi:hypothetical protein
LVGRIGTIVLLALPLLLFIAMVAAYAILLWRMGTATRDFANFLATAEEPAIGDDEAEWSGAPEGAA